MSGEILAAWPHVWKDLWSRFAATQRTTDDIFTTFVIELLDRPREPARPVPDPAAFNDAGELIDPDAIEARNLYEISLQNYERHAAEYDTATASEVKAREYFRRALRAVKTDKAAIGLIERGHQAVVENYDENAARAFYAATKRFVETYNLRYEIRPPLVLHATIPGLFSRLISEIRSVVSDDVHLSALLKDYDEAFADLRAGRTQSRMKTCLQKQYNLLEGLGRRHPEITRNTLGAMCDQISWPHDKIKEVGKGLYHFGSDYPGVRHGGTAANALRSLDLKDFISISLMLSSFAPYLVHDLDSDRCFDAD